MIFVLKFGGQGFESATKYQGKRKFARYIRLSDPDINGYLRPADQLAHKKFTDLEEGDTKFWA